VTKLLEYILDNTELKIPFEIVLEHFYIDEEFYKAHENRTRLTMEKSVFPGRYVEKIKYIELIVDEY
jgi:hypothetical protein